jgi:hypothetical protein
MARDASGKRERRRERERERERFHPTLSYVLLSYPISFLHHLSSQYSSISSSSNPSSLPLPSCHQSPLIDSVLHHLPSPPPHHRSLSSLAAESDETSELVSKNIYAPFMKSVQRLTCGLIVNISSYYYQPLCFWREMYVFVRHCTHPLYFGEICGEKRILNIAY